MTPVIVALFDDFGVATDVRTELVRDGFPTDRVELTSHQEKGQAHAEPGGTDDNKVANYFHALFEEAGDEAAAEEFARRVAQGAAAITVHPRSDHEISSARTILGRHSPRDVREHTGS